MRRGPREAHIRVGRTARYYVLGPEEGPDETWFVLHGYQQLAGRFVQRFRVLDDGRRRIVAPEALSRFYVSQEPGRHGPDSKVGGSWMTREDRLVEIADYVAYLDALREETAVGPVTVLGFSQGVATAARWACMGARPVQRLILWGDHLPPDLDPPRATRALSGVEVILVRGSRDPVLERDAAEKEEAWLRRQGIRFRIEGYDGGHEIDPRLLTELARTLPGA